MGRVIHKVISNRAGISVILTLAIIATLIIVTAGRVSALTMDITEPPSKTLGEAITFSATVQIQDSELLPVQHVDLEIYKQDDPGTYNLTAADLPLAADSKTYSTAGGTVEVEAVPESSWGYGYGYRNAEWDGYGYSWGYGYGYGYQPGDGITSITYNVTWDSLATWPTGTYEIRLIVYANGDTFVEGITVIFEAPAPTMLEAAVDFNPNTLNLKSKGNWITCIVRLPDGYDVQDIDIGTVMLNATIPAAWGNGQGNVLMVKFDRSDVQDMLNPGDNVEVTVSGELIDGTLFEGTDTIRVK